MAKGRTGRDWDGQNRANIDKYTRQIKSLFNSIAGEAALIGSSVDTVNPDRLFTFADYPKTKQRADKLISNLQNDLNTIIVNGVRSSWTLSNNKNNELARQVFGNNVGKLSKAEYRRYFSNNGVALDQFINRKENGLNLSDRVWRYSQQFKKEIEMGLDIGIGNGLSADQMARDLKQYLQFPDKLFRRVRDKHGELQLSKAAQAFHPRAGVYRSSYKNAMRLSRTENNMAYRASDHERWNEFDFVVGFEIRLSNNPNHCPMCEALAGKYPKTYKFVGWHPQCYSNDTELLTNNGWKLFEQLKCDDLIYSLNPETKIPEWVRFTNYYKYHREGKMYRFHNRSLDMLVTPDHKMVYISKSDGKTILSNRIAENYSKNSGGLYRSSDYDGQDIQEITIGTHVICFDLFCEFMAYYLSEGSLFWTRNNQIKITQSKEKHPQQYELIKSCLSKMPFKFSEIQGGFFFNDKCFYQYLKQFGKSPDKHVPKEIKNSSSRQISIFLDAYSICDGHTKKKGKTFVGNRGGFFTPKNRERIFFSSSDQMAADIGEMLTKIGKRPSYKLDKIKGVKQLHRNGVYEGNKDLWRISECHSQTATVFEKTEVSYNGYVYDIELEKNHIFYVRRNGKCVWGSNCRCAALPILKTPDELAAETKQILAGEPTTTESSKEVTELPGNFKEWMIDNKERLARAKSKPYFLRDNEGLVNKKKENDISQIIKQKINLTSKIIDEKGYNPDNFYVDFKAIENGLPISAHRSAQELRKEFGEPILIETITGKPRKLYPREVDYDISDFGKKNLDKKFNSLTAIEVDVSKIEFPQRAVFEKPLLTAKNKAAFAIEIEGRYYVIDGNHSAMKQILEGKSSIELKVIKWDKESGFVISQSELPNLMLIPKTPSGSSALYKQVTKVENEIRNNKKFENAVAFDKDGKVLLDKRGQQFSVTFTNDEVKVLKDTVFTHNHPRGWGYADNSMMRIGSSFSKEDILLAIKHNVAEIRAVTPNYTFVMKRPDKGWGIAFDNAGREINKINDSITADFRRRINNNTTTINKASIVHYHTLWQRFTNKFGIEYLKKKTI